MKFLSFLVLAIMISLLLSCSGNSSSTSPIAAFDFFPLTTGSYWTYQFHLGNDTVNTYSIDSAIIGTSRTIQQISCSPINFWTAGNGTTWTTSGTSYLFNRTDGLHSFVDTTSTAGTVLSVKYPTSVGDSWDIGNFAHMTCQSLSDEVVVPAGTFTNCMRSRSSFNFSTGYSIVWHKPGVGEVRQVFYNSLDGIDSLRNLRSYHIN